MYNFLSCQDVDTEIQNRMSSQSPSESKRKEAIKSVVEEITTQYDIESTVRKETVSVIADGSTIYDISDLISDNDVKRVKAIRFPADSESNEPLFDKKGQEDFYVHLTDGRHINEFTTFYEDGDLKININSYDASSTAVDLELLYYSNYNFIDTSGGFLEEINAIATDSILLPKQFKPLVVAGSLVKLWPIAIGDAAGDKIGRNFNFYKNELKRLGLDGVGSDIKRTRKKINMHHPYRMPNGRRIITD